jgi:UDP-N-acetylglucosamine--N-acetylmuramyl-(pentapeptide) pyrophosphoryl-undecaprenol N-acetylglucosamine transferase
MSRMPTTTNRSETDEDLELLVASGGGHLHELELLRGRFEPELPRAHWVTYGTEEAQRRVVGEPVTLCHFPTSRSLPNAAKNLLLARRVLRRLRPKRVVSTGSGVAVPFLGAAVAMGIDAFYVESAARVEGPSLSGRLLQPVTGASLVTQHPSWADERWSYVGSVFDGFRTEHVGSPDRDRPLRVVISVGTQIFPFDRLIDAVARVTDGRDEIFAQVGPATSAPATWETIERLPPQELERRLQDADVVICHAGVGLMLTAFTVGKAPIVMPRLVKHGEHVDDHQIQIAGSLGERGLSCTLDPGGLERRHLLDQAGKRVISDTGTSTVSLVSGA